MVSQRGQPNVVSLPSYVETPLLSKWLTHDQGFFFFFFPSEDLLRFSAPNVGILEDKTTGIRLV